MKRIAPLIGGLAAGVLLFLLGGSQLGRASTPVRVLAPNGGECLTAGGTYTITWEGDAPHYAIYQTGDTTAAPQYGGWFAHPVTGNSYTWTVPNTPNVPVRIWVEGHDSGHTRLSIDGSDNLLGIASTCGSTSSGGTGSNIPAAPSNLSATLSTSGVDVQLQWTDNSSDEADFKIFRRPVGGSWSFIGGTTSNIPSFTELNVPSGNWEYHVNACNSAGCSADSNIATVSVAASSGGGGGPGADTTPPVISAARVENIIGTGAQIKWTTDEPSDSRIAYGTSVNYGLFSDARCDAGGNVTDHCVNITGLASNTVYYFKVESRNAAGLNAQSGGYQFTSAISAPVGSGTASGSTTPDTTAPSAVADLSLVSSGGGTLTASWTATGDDGSVGTASYYVLKYASAPITSETAWQLGVSVGSLPVPAPAGTRQSATISGLTAGVTYYAALKVFDEAGNASPLSNSPWAVVSSSTAGVPTAPPPLPPPPTAIPGSGIVEGVVKDALGQAVAGAGVRVFSQNAILQFTAAAGGDGSFRTTVPAGDYMVEAFPPAGRDDLLRPQPLRVSVVSGGTARVALEFGAPSKTITGTVLFSNGRPVSDAEVGAFSSETRQWQAAFADALGRYLLRVGPGSWQVGIRPRIPEAARWSWSGPFPQVQFANDATTEAKTVNFAVLVSDATLTVRTVDDDGRVLPDVGVIVDTEGAVGEEGGMVRTPPEFRRSNNSGVVSFTLRTGTLYYLRGMVPPERGYINPQESSITFAAGESREVRLVFRRQEAVRRVVVRGKARLEDGTPTDAYVWAWSEQGGFVQTRTAANGDLSMLVTANERWHLGARKEVNGFPHKAADITVDSHADVLEVDFVLVRLGTAPLPPPVAVSQSAAQTVVAAMRDGASVTVPPGSAGVSGNVNVAMDATVEAPSQAASKVIGTVYEVEVKDASGRSVRELNDDVEIILPYSEEELKDQGITEDELVPSFFDEKTGTWVKLESYTIDRVKNVVVARVRHLTRFALVAAADTTPPAAPLSVAARAASGGVLISWANPLADFDHVKIYRSARQGSLGNVIFPEVKGTSKVDATTAAGAVYYYVVRSVDPAGNESTNTNAVSAVGILSSGGGGFSRNLTVGMRGGDVTLLQQLLVKENVYPEGVVSGYFGALTKAATIRFQEKYASSILTPAGLTKGTGFVGAATRRKLEEIAGSAADEAAPQAPTLEETIRQLQEQLRRLQSQSGGT
jgi:hypothetical protein